MATPMLFREHGQTEWIPASTVNVSPSGVLFRATGRVPGPGRPVSFIVTLPTSGRAPGPSVRCTGQVVRIASEEPERGGHAVAVSIDHYDIERWCPA